jgi:hypothetical protein
MYTYAALNRFFGEESENSSSEAYERFLDFLSDDEGSDEPSSVEPLNKRNILMHKVQLQRYGKEKPLPSTNHTKSEISQGSYFT